MDEMNDGSVQVVAAGGADGGRIGTSAIKIQGAIESVEDCDHILILSLIHIWCNCYQQSRRRQTGYL